MMKERTSFRDWLSGLGCSNYRELEMKYGKEMAAMEYQSYQQEQKELLTQK
ncbi:hypothetical protein [Weissella viridescens]|uniref:hypothetical protein n=1 Tax=Weissella viridescens TaxID=1629 RepID=UPI003528DB3A